MIDRVAPPYTSRRLVLQLVRHGLRSPGTLGHRVNRHNAGRWRRGRALVATCNICGHRGRLLDEMLDLELFARHRIGPTRETLRCRGCGSKMRDRVLAATLLDVLAERGVVASTIEALAAVLPDDVRILDTDANSRLARRLAAHPGFHRSLFVPGVANGADLGERYLNADLEDLPYPDRYFDVVITSEVLEHVRYVDRAHREVARCLKPTGEHVFTVPYDASLGRTWLLVDPDTDEDLVDEPHVHGDPELRAEGIRSYRVFGRDLVDDLAAAGLDCRFAPVDRPEVGVLAGDVFRATPHPAPDRACSTPPAGGRNLTEQALT